MSGELAEAVIDLTAIADNVRTISAVARTGLMAVVKADGFGHGAAPVARAALAAGVSWLGVTSTTEALVLRTAGIRAPMLSWLHRPNEDFTRLIGADVDIAVSTLAHLHTVAAAGMRLGVPAMVQLKADVGLSRNGAVSSDWPELVAWARKYEVEGGLRVRGVWSHLTNAEAELTNAEAELTNAESASASTSPITSTARQTATFLEALQVARGAGLAPELVHLANSAAALAAPAARFDLCRIGVALYGVDPFGATGPGRFGLRPAMTLRTSVINVKRVPAGSGVSYGPEHVTGRPTTLALIPLGYADGLSRTTEGRASVWLGGRRCRIVGRIAMDQCVVDAGDLPVALGDPVVVFGPDSGVSNRAASSAPDVPFDRADSFDQADPGSSDLTVPTVAEWARWAGTNPHEVLTGVGSRVARAYIDGER
ncbi:alanine racemase [Micromonospora pisi]|uniref:Alanine racemase n=1 Tax=Micromonospora pisi TaxID=589240 RepID=A0A495JQK6_9ACTN|nr:alanine racemase [Micromonospora pisi]RKR90654.1 alanine racemase [Micromonospora pisi]